MAAVPSAILDLNPELSIRELLPPAKPLSGTVARRSPNLSREIDMMDGVDVTAAVYRILERARLNIPAVLGEQS